MWLFLVENVVFIGVDPKININLGRTDLASEFFIFFEKIVRCSICWIFTDFV